MDIASIINEKLVNNLSDEFDKILVEGLKLKGFCFENRIEIENFIKNNCRCNDFVEKQQRVFYVNEFPFLLHSYKIEPALFSQENNAIKITANYGYYKYL